MSEGDKIYREKEGEERGWGTWERRWSLHSTGQSGKASLRKDLFLTGCPGGFSHLFLWPYQVVRAFYRLEAIWISLFSFISWVMSLFFPLILLSHPSIQMHFWPNQDLQLQPSQHLSSFAIVPEPNLIPSLASEAGASLGPFPGPPKPASFPGCILSHRREASLALLPISFLPEWLLPGTSCLQGWQE